MGNESKKSMQNHKTKSELDKSQRQRDGTLCPSSGCLGEVDRVGFGLLVYVVEQEKKRCGREFKIKMKSDISLVGISLVGISLVDISMSHSAAFRKTVFILA